MIRMKMRTPVDGHPKAHEDGSAWLLGAVLAGGTWWRGAEQERGSSRVEPKMGV
jgi:hypothetical protein